MARLRLTAVIPGRATPLNLSFRGAPARRLIRIGGYGFRAPSLRSGPGMTAERLDASE